MSNKAKILLNYLQSEYQNRIESNKNITDDSARMFDVNELCDKYNIDRSLMDKLISELKQYGYIKKLIIGTIVLERD